MAPSDPIHTLLNAGVTLLAWPWWQGLSLLLLAVLLSYWGLTSLGLWLARAREFGSRLWRLLLALWKEVFWVDPARRRDRLARWREGWAEGELTFAAQLSEMVIDLLSLPVDWLASLGLQRMLRPDPACEEKQRRRTGESAGLALRLRWVLKRHLTIYLLLSLLRLITPRVRLPGLAWKAMVHPDSYAPDFPITGMVWFTLNTDVREVLGRPETFEVIYGPRMRLATRRLDLPPDDAGDADPSERGNFLLGMQDTPRYWRDSSNMRLAFRREDAERCRRLAERAAGAALQRAIDAQRGQALTGAPFTLDLPVDLVVPAVEALVTTYFGIPVPLRCPDGPQSGGAWVDLDHGWLAVIFKYLFYDLKGEESLPLCLEDAPRVRQALQEIIRRAHDRQDPAADDVLSRCLRLQRSGTPGMDDETLRVNLTGFLVGAMTPLINATCQVIEVLLARPRALAQAQAAARSRDAERLRACVMEALRFLPGDPVIYRWTNADTWIGAGSGRCFVPHGTLVMAWNSSAMFDPAAVPAPWEFRPDRPADAYLHWGHGQHACAGAYLNMAVIPAILAPLLRQSRLQRAPGAAGQPSMGGRDGITIRHFELLVRPAPEMPCTLPPD